MFKIIVIQLSYFYTVYKILIMKLYPLSRYRISIFVLFILFGMPLQSLYSQGVNNTVFTGVTVDVFDEYYDMMIANSIGYSYKHQLGTASLKLNRAYRFNSVGYQTEVEFYPKFKNGWYAYAAYAYSGAVFLPKHRAGLELFVPFAKKWETSAGLRFLSFQTGTTTWIFTGSLSNYFHSWLFSVRPFIIPTNQNWGGALIVNARKFLNDTDAIGLRLGMGASPDERLVLLNNNTIANDVLLLLSQQIAIYANHNFSKSWQAKFSLGLNRDELAFWQGNYVWHCIFDFSIAYSW